MAKVWGCRPSVLLGLSDDDFIAYCVDEAIFAFGTAIESDLNSMRQNKKESSEAFARRKQNRFTHLLEAHSDQKFANPVLTR